MPILKSGTPTIEATEHRSSERNSVELTGPGQAHGMIPKVMHFAVPTKPSQKQRDIIKRATDAHPTWAIRVWDDDAAFPESPLSNYLKKCRSGAQFADLVRIEAVFREGGVYLDSDMRVLRPLDKLIQSWSFFIASEDGDTLTNACFGATPYHPALQSIIGYLAENEPDWDLPPNVTTGPGLFATLLHWRSDICILPRETFYPYHHYHSVRLPHELSYCEHLWEGSWLSGWTWTGIGYSKIEDQQPETMRNKLSGAVRGSVRNALRPLAGIAGRAVARHVAKPLASYPVSGKIVISTIHGHQLVADGHDYSLTPRLVRDGYLELASERFVAKTLKGGDWFVDVGANIGLFSLIAAAKCGRFGRVFAFEPNPAMANLLMESAALNWYHDRIIITQIALSDVAGTMQLQVPQGRTGDARIVRQSGADEEEPNGAFEKTRLYLPNQTVLEVEANTLDALFAVDVPIKILKIDAEGHEANILAGAERLLAARVFDYIMVEAISDVGVQKWKRTLAWLTKIANFGYRVCTPDQDGNLIHHASLGIALSQMADNNLIFKAGRANA
jgi:FkbM family methyltransferase